MKSIRHLKIHFTTRISCTTRHVYIDRPVMKKRPELSGDRNYKKAVGEQWESDSIKLEYYLHRIASGGSPATSCLDPLRLL